MQSLLLVAKLTVAATMAESSEEEPTLAQLYGSQRAAAVAAELNSDDSAMPDWMETHVRVPECCASHLL